MIRAYAVVYIAILNIMSVHNGAIQYEVVLENASNCSKPVPPYPRKQMFSSTFVIHRHKGTVFLGGYHRVLAEFMFHNFSVSTYRMGARQPELLAQLDKLDCRSIFGKMFLLMGGFRYSSKDCRVERGTYKFMDIDFNKLLHSVPNWHFIGSYVHRSSLTYNHTSVFCFDFSILVKN